MTESLNYNSFDIGLYCEKAMLLMFFVVTYPTTLSLSTERKLWCERKQDKGNMEDSV